MNLKTIDVVGSSKRSWDEAGKIAYKRASYIFGNIVSTEVAAQDIKELEDRDKTLVYRTKLRVSYTWS